MNTTEGYIKLYRSVTDWEWYDDANTFRVFMHLLLLANYEDREWRGRTIRRGQVVTSYQKLAKELKLTERNIRTAINHLKSTGEVTYCSTPKFGLITINNFDSFQQVTDNPTPDRQTSDKQVTDNRQQLKNIRSKEEKNIPPYSPPAGDETVKTQERFEEFWGAYPRKAAKQAAIRAWEKLNPDALLTKKIVDSVTQQSHTEQWRKDGGRFIPYPASWLNGRRWEDEQTAKNSRPSYDIGKINGSFNDFDSIGW